ncbi:hypothetical protein [Shimazuella kribbensis]|uniref:hypothetical protein n=1 Tax=Shimazuella kribbensis TaxID=139808 RepID=UPI0004917875|nr:hypothetical protein [Shimazuella kribbensis]
MSENEEINRYQAQIDVLTRVQMHLLWPVSDDVAQALAYLQAEDAMRATTTLESAIGNLDSYIYQEDIQSLNQVIREIN